MRAFYLGSFDLSSIVNCNQDVSQGCHHLMTGVGGFTFKVAHASDCWQETVVSCLMNFSKGLLDSLHDMAADFLQSE